MKKFRVFCTDPDATDSSSDDENDVVPKPFKRKRFFREVNVGGDPPEKSRTPPSTVDDPFKKKYPGVRMRKWGKFASEIRHPVNKVRIWLGTFDTPQEAYDVYYMKKLEFDALRASLNLRSNNINSHDDPCVSVENSAFVNVDNAGKSLVDGSTSCEAVNVDNNVNNDVSLGVTSVEKVVEVPLGVERVKSGKWIGRINYPDSSGRIWIGMFNTMEEAVMAYEKKNIEFEERFKGKESGDEGNCEGGEVSSGVKINEDGRWEARVWHPKKKSLVSLGCYCSHEEAMMAVNKCVERLKSMDSGTEGICEGGELASGVRKNGDGKWEARVKHPMLKTLVSLGCYCSPEEALMAVNKKEDEFEESFKGKENVNDCLARRKLPRGVRENGHGRWQARVWHPKKKMCVNLGVYNCPKEAGRAISRKRHQFEKMYGYNSRVEPESGVENMGEVFIEGSKWDGGIRETDSGKWAARIQHPTKKGMISLGTYNTKDAAVRAFNKKKTEFQERFNSNERLNVHREIVLGLAAPSLYVDDEPMKEKVANFDINGAKNSEFPKDGVLPDGIALTKSGRWGVRVAHPSTGTKQWVGSYLTIEEAVRTFNRKKAEFNEKFNSKKRARLCPESNIAQKMPDSAASPTSVLDNGSSNNSSIDDEPNNILVDVPMTLDNDSVNESSDAVSGMSKSGVADTPNFDEAVRLGIINEYGQLLGRFSKLDEPMWCAPNEDDIFLGFY